MTCLDVGLPEPDNDLKKNVNRDSHIASSPISQRYFLEEVRCLILAASQRKLCGHIEFCKFDITIKKKNFNQTRLKLKNLHRFLQNLVSNITQHYCIYAQNFSLMNRSLPELDNFKKILKKFKI